MYVSDKLIYDKIWKNMLGFMILSKSNMGGCDRIKTNSIEIFVK